MLKKSLLVIPFLYFVSCAPTIKTSAENRNALVKHRNVAILPFEISMGSKLHQADKFTEPEKEELRKYLSISMQGHLYDLLKQKQKRFPFSVTIQSAELTNYLLSAKKISFAVVFGNDKKEICRILGVDAVISTQTIFGKQERADFNDILNRGSLESNFAIYDSVSTERLWIYHKNVSENIFKDITKTTLSNTVPEAFYTPENKYQKVLIPWIPAVDAMFDSFTADFPYKKK